MVSLKKVFLDPIGKMMPGGTIFSFNQTRSGLKQILPERFKTRAAYFPAWRDERTGMQRETLGKSGSEAAS